MEFVFIFPVVLIQVVLVNFLQVVEIVRAFGIDALMEDEVFPVLLGNKSIAAVRAARV
ncbi:MAG: hypothetical protein ACLRT5_01115 [Lachnospiraceae bacterium]